MRQISLSVVMTVLLVGEVAGGEMIGAELRSSGGIALAQRSTPIGQRPWKRQAFGSGSIGLRGLPSSRGRASPRRAGSGIAATSACV